MISRDGLAVLIADVMMPGAPGLVLAEAERISDAILDGRAVVSLPTSSYEDDQGISWDSDDGVPLASASGEVVWVHDDMLEVDEAEEWAGALLAAARAARGVRR
jgi:hypothetical protein